MPVLTRKNAWNNNGTFSNPDLLWYAKAVGVMQTRPLNDPTSWWFYAAIHGQSISDNPGWGTIPPPPNVPTTPLPSSSLISQYWDQCQHGGWFFPPWHRGYLYAIENILRGIVAQLGGPSDWALPYWNYFGPGNQYQMPPAFAQKTLPDGSANPLFVNARYGPNNDGNIFVPFSWGINQNCQSNTVYTGRQPAFYGGNTTGFAHFASGTGSLEGNPHNPVHVAVGGQDPTTGQGGLMGDPDTAGLDPIFYLHHCNIDRMWASWNAAGNSNPTDPNWLNGPNASGNRQFYMPTPAGTPWLFTPAMVNDISQLNYTYDNLTLGITPTLVSQNALRLRNFGLSVDDSKLLNAKMDENNDSELVGANSAPLKVDAKGAQTNVQLDSSGWNNVAKSLKTTTMAQRLSENKLPDQVYLQLEGIKGKEDSVVCSVTVNNQYAGHLSLFGLKNASQKDGPHGGSGLTIRFDISSIVDKLELSNALDINSLEVHIQPVNVIADGNELTIDRVSIYREEQG
ncbi:tyrosinase family protein [Emticicia sp. 17c]|uniref:tyrosinase family protein n=1 Tax=Emticicia sp. 17c TaxID=3127704 RepID=UPI00301CBAB0